MMKNRTTQEKELLTQTTTLTAPSVKCHIYIVGFSSIRQQVYLQAAKENAATFSGKQLGKVTS